jgi:protein-ribulosamine 3-kinase
MITQAQKDLITGVIEKHTGQREKIISVQSISGGDINQAFKVATETGTWFAKLNSSTRFPGMFKAEAMGLELLLDTNEIKVPLVAGYADDDQYSVLVLEYIQQGPQNPSFWQHFGQQLARLHKNHSSKNFGLDHDNYIGSLAQRNTRMDNWTEFFIMNRLEVQIKLARDAAKIDSSTSRQFEKTYAYLPEFFPVEPSSLVHGDLWSGNFMINKRGEAAIIDPAVYYGHRLMDLGMSKLFGGFAPEFYSCYHDEYPLEKNWPSAIELANLYPLMVHVNLFGGGYLSSVKAILKKIV